MKKLNNTVLLVLIFIGIAGLCYLTYSAGYKASESEMDSLLMTMTLDSNFVTAGLYEELPDNVRRTMQFFIEDTPTHVNGVKLFAQVKYVTIGGELIDIEKQSIWKIIKKDKIFQRKFENQTGKKKEKLVPTSPFAKLSN